MRVSSYLLDDTLKLFQLVRETARINGQPSQFERLTPLVDNLTTLVTETQAISHTLPPDSISSVMAQKDFKTLLATVQSKTQTTTELSKTSGVSTHTDRSYIITAMSDGGMNTLDIARQMGMTIDEVNLVLTLSKLRPFNT